MKLAHFFFAFCESFSVSFCGFLLFFVCLHSNKSKHEKNYSIILVYIADDGVGTI